MKLLKCIDNVSGNSKKSITIGKWYICKKSVGDSYDLKVDSGNLGRLFKWRFKTYTKEEFLKEVDY